MLNDFNHFETLLRDRLRSIDSRSDAGNGTLLADATATLMAADAVTARVRSARVAALSDDVLQEAMTTVQLMLAAEERADAVLPFGTVAVTNEMGSATVAGQVYVLVERLQGMVREELAPRQFEGANLEHLLRLIEQRSKRLACRSLGRPEPLTDEGLVEEYAFRFAACAEAGGVSLEVPLGIRPIAWMTHARLITLTDDVVRAMRTFWRQRRKIAKRAAHGAAVFAEVVRTAGPGAEGLALAGIVAQPFEMIPDENVSLNLLVTTLDEALRPTIARWPVFSGSEAPDMIRRMIRAHASAFECVASREPIEIDELAAAIAEAAPEGAAAVLKRLAATVATDVILPLHSGRSLATRLHWVCGMIFADIAPTEKVTHQSNCFMIFDGDWPETIADSLVGRGIGEIIDLPMVCPFPIRHVERFGPQSLRLSFHTDARRVDLKTGTIGPVEKTTPPKLAA